jgi:hypothetical protein
MKLSKLLEEWFDKDIVEVDKLEAKYAELNELKIDDLYTHEYQETEYPELPTDYKAWSFQDRCGNELVVVYIPTTGDFKSGYRVKGISGLVFDPAKLKDRAESIRPCPDDQRVNTVYKILVQEVIPKYLLKKRPNRLRFDPVSPSREKLVDMIINKVIQKYPELKKKNNYILYP